MLDRPKISEHVFLHQRKSGLTSIQYQQHTHRLVVLVGRPPSKDAASVGLLRPTTARRRSK